MKDKQEFEAVFRHYYKGMYVFALRMLHDEAESKDVVSEVFAQLLNSTVNLHSTTLQGFLHTSVRNRCINLLAHQQRTQAVIADWNPTTSEVDEELLGMIHRFVSDELPPLSQQVLRLRYHQGLKYREIAEELQVSEVTVHNHLSQSLKRIKEHLKSLGYGIK